VTHASVLVTLRADANQVDDTGNVWAFLSDADDPTRIWPGAIIVAGDPVEPFMAQVVDIVDGPRDEAIVHLDVLGTPDQTIDELRHARIHAAVVSGPITLALAEAQERATSPGIGRE
jgi:hypothetical protein